MDLSATTNFMGSYGSCKVLFTKCCSPRKAVATPKIKFIFGNKMFYFCEISEFQK